MSLTRPIVLMHGITSSSTSMLGLRKFIRDKFPAAEIYLANIAQIDSMEEVLTSTLPMDGQVQLLRNYLVHKNLNTREGGFDVICHSQGGILFRGYIAEYADHNVHSFIALSSPLMGQFGMFQFVPSFFFNLTQDAVISDLMYSDDYQERLSIAGYWKDPTKWDDYLEHCKYLPKINNESKKTRSKEYKTNFQKLKRIVLIGGPDDGLITPWQSAMFDYYKNGSTSNNEIVDMRRQFVYESIGLDELDRHGRIFRYEISGVIHINWIFNRGIFNTYILPHLTDTNIPPSNHNVN